MTVDPAPGTAATWVHSLIVVMGASSEETSLVGCHKEISVPDPTSCTFTDVTLVTRPKSMTRPTPGFRFPSFAEL